MFETDFLLQTLNAPRFAGDASQRLVAFLVETEARCSMHATGGGGGGGGVGGGDCGGDSGGGDVLICDYSSQNI
jgi:hypothetical protein